MASFVSIFVDVVLDVDCNNPPLKFGQYLVSNGWDIVVVAFVYIVVVTKCITDFEYLLGGLCVQRHFVLGPI